MAQFDVYANPSAASRAGIPYFVDVQSDLLSGLQTRLMLPLGSQDVVPSSGPRSLCPTVEIQGCKFKVLPHLAAAIRPRDLGKPVASLSTHASELVAALDAVISGV